MTRHLGLRNTATDGLKWRYLLFYDFDGQSPKVEIIDQLMRYMHCSYLFYSTKHGYHLIGLTPLELADWCYMFIYLQQNYPSYYVGQTVRLSQKKGEVQKLVMKSLNRGSVIPQLYNIYAKRFKLPLIKHDGRHAIRQNNWHLIFERYSTSKD